MDMGRGKERVRCMEKVTRQLTLPYVLTEAKDLKCPIRKLLGYILTMEMPLIKQTLAKDF